MAVGKRIARALVGLLTAVGIFLWFAALVLFTKVTENSDDFAQGYGWILLINVVGIGVLLVLIVSNLWQLVRDHRRHVPGSRLRARMVSVLVMVAVTPLVGVYIFSVEFINRGIDSWFSVDVQKSLDDAFELGKTVLESQKRNRRDEVRDLAESLAKTRHADLAATLSALRNASDALELTIYGSNNQIVAMSSVDLEPRPPRYPNEEVLLPLRQREPYVAVEPQPDGQIRIVAAAAITAPTARGDFEFVQATFPMDQRLVTLANGVFESFEQRRELNFLGTPLKYGFTLTLSLVLLISLLASVYGAFFFARRLVVPIQLLMQGTRAVARGDFATRVPTPTRDEIGFLVHSFNDMTQRLAKASEEARSSQQQVERERSKLEVILARLSTGVVSLEHDLRIRTANHAAGAILGVDLEYHVGESAPELARAQPLLGQFLETTQSHLDRGDKEWREQIVLRDEGGRRVLMCACTELPSDTDGPGGYAIVFDDITALLQAQRDAAWGEGVIEHQNSGLAQQRARSATQRGERWHDASRTRSRIR